MADLSSQHGDRTGNGASNGVSARALITALILLVLMAPAGFYLEVAWYYCHWFATWTPAMAPVVLLLLLTGAMGLPGLRRVGFTRRELLVIYSIVLVGGPLVGRGLLVWLVSHDIAYYYSHYMNPGPDTAFLHYLPTWFATSDPAAVEAFFLGHATVPWSLWWMPLATWLSFGTCLFLSSSCLMLLLERQWIRNERLSFPIAQIPLEMVRQSETGGRSRAGRLPVAFVFWFGLAISVFVGSIDKMFQYVPNVPVIPLGPAVLVDLPTVGPLAGIGAIWYMVWPWIISIAYLVPKELSFSVWFFHLVRIGLTAIAIAGGADPKPSEDFYGSAFPAPYLQGHGAVMALLLWVLWVARGHLSGALRMALGRRREGADAAEAPVYRWALIGFIIATAWMLCFLWLAGCRLIFGVALIGLILGYYVMWARVRAETGLGFVEFPLFPEDLMTRPFGSAALRPKEIISLISLRWTYAPGGSLTWDALPANVLETLKIADTAHINKRRLAPALAAGFVVSLGVGVYVVLTGIYRYGFVDTPGWSGVWFRSPLSDSGIVAAFLTDPRLTRPDPKGVVAFLVGGAVAVLLGAIRLRYWWWPFHPVGYIMANTWSMHWYYMPFFIGWLGKSLVTRYGGLRLYRRTVPLAVGLIVGHLLNDGMWGLIAMAIRSRH